MYKKFEQAGPRDIPIGSHLNGHVKATLNELKAVCGRAFTDQEESDYEFFVLYKGFLISIYDRNKVYGQSDKYLPDEIIEWNVGCNNHNLHWVIQEALDKYREENGPAPDIRTKVIIMVQGGLVQAIHTSNPDRVHVEVYDLDYPSNPSTSEIEEMDNRVHNYHRAIRGLDNINW